MRRCWAARRLPYGHHGRPNPPEVRTLDRSYTVACMPVFRVLPPRGGGLCPGVAEPLLPRARLPLVLPRSSDFEAQPSP